MSCANTTYVNPLNGNISFANGFAQYYHTIVTNVGQTLLDVSAFGGTGWRIFLEGLKDLNGSATGYLSKAGDANPFTGAAFTCGSMTITYDIGCSITFNALIGKSTITQNYDGKVEITTQWAYSDSSAPSISWPAS